MSDDLNVLFPGKELTVGGETLTVMPFPFGMTLKVISVLRKISSDLGGESVNILAVIEQGGDDLFNLAAMAINKPREWLDALPVNEGTLVVSAVIEINKDVFTRGVLPQIEKLAALFGLTTGETSLEASSQPATDGPTSSTTPSDKSDSSSA